VKMWPERHVAFKCPSCGRLEPAAITIFSFSGQRTAAIECLCGAKKLSVTTKNHKSYLVQFPCLVCEETHITTLTPGEFWTKPVITFECPETEVELGHLGEPNQIKQAMEVQRGLSELLPEDLSIEDYFSCPEIMYQILSMLHEIAKSGNLYCECGNDNVEVDLFPDKLELRCPSCNSLSIIYAENEEDLQAMKRVEVIEMKKAGFTSVDASRFNHKPARKGQDT
jgi:DNA-directed RNA polymerase subunit RPC12/RpoP